MHNPQRVSKYNVTSSVVIIENKTTGNSILFISEALDYNSYRVIRRTENSYGEYRNISVDSYEAKNKQNIVHWINEQIKWALRDKDSKVIIRPKVEKDIAIVNDCINNNLI